MTVDHQFITSITVLAGRLHRDWDQLLLSNGTSAKYFYSTSLAQNISHSSRHTSFGTQVPV